MSPGSSAYARDSSIILPISSGVVEVERLAFEDEGVESLPKVKRGEDFCVDECPLLGQADVAIDCGAYEWPPNRCIFFEGQRYYLIRLYCEAERHRAWWRVAPGGCRNGFCYSLTFTMPLHFGYVLQP